jgi:hypothetical protein
VLLKLVKLFPLDVLVVVSLSFCRFPSWSCYFLEEDCYLRILLQSLDFLTLCTKIDPGDLKARSRVLIDRVFRRTLKLHRFKLLMVLKIVLNYRFSSLKKKVESSLFKNPGL